ncbi:MAG TPA: hypothetical protein VGR67_13470 [Candidatus Polarisedimenticolia bacterium]|jgi:hypothetical protein|nr:hypothetical protein [Candidatus Polarisedimenticolia bacterium]
MKRLILAASLVAALGTAPVAAGELENALERQWRGAWVLTGLDAYSDCAGIHTDNQINGALVQAKGQYRFKPGELARVQSIDLKRTSVEIGLSLQEPLLHSFQDGPFTLYREIRCLVDLDVELPRALVAGKDLKEINDFLQPILARYFSPEDALRSRAWNGRVRDPFPADYERTMARHDAWKAEQSNAAVQTRIDQAREETARLVDRISNDPDYLRGFAAGIEVMRSQDLTRCSDILGRDFATIASSPERLLASMASDAAARTKRGYQDGARMVFGLESLRRLPECLVPVPEAPPGPDPKS